VSKKVDFPIYYVIYSLCECYVLTRLCNVIDTYILIYNSLWLNVTCSFKWLGVINETSLQHCILSISRDEEPGERIISLSILRKQEPQLWSRQKFGNIQNYLPGMKTAKKLTVREFIECLWRKIAEKIGVEIFGRGLLLTMYAILSFYNIKSLGLKRNI